MAGVKLCHRFVFIFFEYFFFQHYYLYLSYCLFFFTESDREDYVKELEKYFPVHIYGGCGTCSCPENDCGSTYNIKSKCLDFISENYMFYLSFENSICLDYVTEKFFKALNVGILPIVLGKYDL